MQVSEKKIGILNLEIKHGATTRAPVSGGTTVMDAMWPVRAGTCVRSSLQGHLGQMATRAVASRPSFLWAPFRSAPERVLAADACGFMAGAINIH